jgi:hypothetical protein
VEATSKGKNSFSIVNSFTSQHFVDAASSCAVCLGVIEELEKATRGGEWKLIKNFSIELGLYLKIDLTHIFSDS